MPQLRHSETSALLAESTDPLALVVVAQAVGLDRVVFDDVGAAFDLDAAIAAADARVATPSVKGLDADTTKYVRAQAKEAQARRATLEGDAASAVAALLEAERPDPEPVDIDAQLAG